MLSMHLNPSDKILPQWFLDLLGSSFLLAEGEEVKINSEKSHMSNSILRVKSIMTKEQRLTKRADNRVLREKLQICAV